MRYEEAWKEQRRRGRVFLLCWIGGPLGVLLGYAFVDVVIGRFLSPPQRKSFGDTALFVLALTWVLVTAFARFRHADWPCPRCGQSFELRGTFSNPLTSRCLHCGLPRGASESEAK